MFVCIFLPKNDACITETHKQGSEPSHWPYTPMMPSSHKKPYFPGAAPGKMLFLFSSLGRWAVAHYKLCSWAHMSTWVSNNISVRVEVRYFLALVDMCASACLHNTYPLNNLRTIRVYEYGIQLLGRSI